MRDGRAERERERERRGECVCRKKAVPKTITILAIGPSRTPQAVPNDSTSTWGPILKLAGEAEGFA
jgi:hypothetical protein